MAETHDQYLIFRVFYSKKQTVYSVHRSLKNEFIKIIKETAAYCT